MKQPPTTKTEDKIRQALKVDAQTIQKGVDYVFEKQVTQISNLLLEARIDEAKLFHKFCLSHNFDEADDWIKARTQQLKAQLKGKERGGE